MKTPVSITENRDCLEAMKTFPDKYFELAVVDPPYGIGMDGGNVGYKGFNDFEKKDWDASTPSGEYFKELSRVSKNQIIWGGNYFELPPSRCFLIWDKGEGFYNRTYAECEQAWTSFDKNAKIFKRDPLAKGDYHGKIHPTQKPVALYKWLLSNYAKEGDKILDTHMGSQSSRIAAYLMGFDYWGYEIDGDYFQDGNKRFLEQTAQQSLFGFNQKSA
jgi:site-specific DNA-methyltransferase (adenine-specific)